MKKGTKKALTIILLSIIFVSICYICIKLIPLLASLKNAENQSKFKNYIQKMGFFGWLTVLTIQVLQIFIAFIPGEIVEILSGMLYGSIGGLLLCLLGILIGSILIYVTIKFFTKKNLKKYKDKLSTYSFLNNPKKIHIYFFVIFITPGIPKDIFIYLVPFLPIKFSSFLFISLIARIPSILSSTIVGSSIADGNFLTSIIIFASFTFLGIISVLFYDKILKKFNKDERSQLNNNNNTMEN